MDGGYFESCTAYDQGGAVFYRIDQNYSYRQSTVADLRSCQFVHCEAAAWSWTAITAS